MTHLKQQEATSQKSARNRTQRNENFCFRVLFSSSSQLLRFTLSDTDHAVSNLLVHFKYVFIVGFHT